MSGDCVKAKKKSLTENTEVTESIDFMILFSVFSVHSVRNSCFYTVS